MCCSESAGVFMRLLNEALNTRPGLGNLAAYTSTFTIHHRRVLTSFSLHQPQSDLQPSHYGSLQSEAELEATNAVIASFGIRAEHNPSHRVKTRELNGFITMSFDSAKRPAKRNRQRLACEPCR